MRQISRCISFRYCFSKGFRMFMTRNTTKPFRKAMVTMNMHQAPKCTASSFQRVAIGTMFGPQPPMWAVPSKGHSRKSSKPIQNIWPIFSAMRLGPTKINCPMSFSAALPYAEASQPSRQDSLYQRCGRSKARQNHQYARREAYR